MLIFIFSQNIVIKHMRFSYKYTQNKKFGRAQLSATWNIVIMICYIPFSP